MSVDVADIFGLESRIYQRNAHGANRTRAILCRGGNVMSIIGRAVTAKLT